jgi:hypothetical protein
MERVAAEAARVAAELEAARVADELEAVKSARVAAELEAERVADELEALETARLSAEAARLPDEPEAPAVADLPREEPTEVRPTGFAAGPATGTRDPRADAENKAIAFLFASAIVLFGLSRRAKRRAS